MDFRMLAYYLLLLIQAILIFVLFYFSGRIILTMYSISPLYKGKVPYVPTRRRYIRKAFKFLDIREGERIVDLGCGNGQFLVYGARRIAADFVGVELNAALCWIAQINRFLARKRGTVIIKHKSYYDESLKGYDKVFFFNMPSEMDRLVPKLEKELGVGVKVVSVMFPVKSGKFKLLSEFGEKYKIFLYERIE